AKRIRDRRLDGPRWERRRRGRRGAWDGRFRRFGPEQILVVLVPLAEDALVRLGRLGDVEGGHRNGRRLRRWGGRNRGGRLVQGRGCPNHLLAVRTPDVSAEQVEADGHQVTAMRAVEVHRLHDRADLARVVGGLVERIVNPRRVIARGGDVRNRPPESPGLHPPLPWAQPGASAPPPDPMANRIAPRRERGGWSLKAHGA